ncbi:MAG: efflux RND transporter periplasmic adaptor subunit [Isosphaeraceae bacterium]|nr:efflux RND transporter periplasmic adaptor subunit [Isosphaeraceae bacterium]
MSARRLLRLVLPVVGMLFTTGFVVQSGALESRLPAWAAERCQKARSTRAEPSGQPQHVEPPRVMAEGRVVAYPGAEVVVGTEAVGRIVRLNVQEKSPVRKGDLVAELNADDLKASRAEAEARVAEAESDIRYFDRELQRDESLVARRAGTIQNIDVNRRGLDSARARCAGAAADRERINALLAKTRIVAPIDGVITERHAHPGETVEVAAKIVTIADLNRIRIEAEVDEFDTGRVVLGADVAITAEGFPGASWKGKVEEIPDSVVPRRIRPEDPGRPIDARVLPVKITFSEPTPLKLGQRVEVQIVTQEAQQEASAR